MSEENNWRDSLPDEIKGNEALATFEDIGALANSYLEAKSYQGSSIKIPGEDAGEDDRNTFYEKLMKNAPNLMVKPDFENPEQSSEFFRTLGTPEKPDGYSIPDIDAPEGVEIQTEKLEGLREIAFKNNLTTKQFEGMLKDVMEQDIAAAQESREVMTTNLSTVKEKWGMAFEDNMKKIGTLLSKTGAPEAIFDSVKTGAMDITAVEWLYNMGKQMGGEGFNFDDADVSDSKPAKMTPEDAQNAIDEINNNSEHPYWVGTGAEKKRAIERMIELQKYANPTAGTEMLRAGAGG